MIYDLAGHLGEMCIRDRFCYWAKLLGFNPINVLSSPTWAMPTVILVSVWKNFGFNMVILLRCV